MPMGILSDEMLEKELENSNKIPLPKHKDNPIGIVETVKGPGRGKDTPNVPDSLRELIGVDHVENGRGSAIALAESFGISKQSELAYANGSHSPATYNKKNPALASKIQSARLRIAKKARGKLHLALDAITEDKLAELKPVDASVIARNMASIVKEMEPSFDNEKDADNKTPQIIIYAPKVTTEDKFPTITVND